MTQGSQTITFGTQSGQSFGTAPFSISATATSGLTVTFASNSTGICTVSGSTVTLVAIGTCSITASQAGNANYAAATPVTQTFSVTQGTQTITFNAPGTVTLPASALSLTATASSGLTVSFASNSTSVCTVSGSSVTPLTAGTCSITASQAGNANYAAATPVTQTFVINPASTSGGGGGGGGGGGVGSIVGTLAAAPTSLNFSVPVGTTSSQTVTVTYQNLLATGPQLQAAVTATSNSGITWLTVSPASVNLKQTGFDGTTFTYTGTVTITTDASRFGSGNVLTGTVSFTAVDGSVPPPSASASITMTVADPPKLTAAPQSLSFTYQQGSTSKPAPQSIAVTGNISGLTYTAAASTVSGGNWLSVSSAGGQTPGSVPVTVNVANLGPGTYSGTVTLVDGVASAKVPVTLTILASNAPVISASGIVPVYSTLTSIEAGSWISIYGTNLSDSTATWNGDFPTTLGGVSVTINGKAAYLWYVSPTQINVQAPDDTATGVVTVVVTTLHGSFSSTVTLAPASPSFSLLDGKHAAAVILTPAGTGAYGGGTYDLLGPAGAFPFSTRAVKAGEVLELFGVGFGPTNPPVPAGQPFSGAAPTVNPVTITVGGVPANVSFAGITGAGLYQFNLTVPSVGSGDRSIQATVNGVQTQPGPVITVQ